MTYSYSYTVKNIKNASLYDPVTEYVENFVDSFGNQINFKDFELLNFFYGTEFLSYINNF